MRCRRRLRRRATARGGASRRNTLLGSHSLNAAARAAQAIKMATSAELYASAQILGTECATANMAFLKCKAEAQHPRHCLEAGTAVTVLRRRKSTAG